MSCDWHHLDVSPVELRLHTTLFCGQVFRWRRVRHLSASKKMYVGVIRMEPFAFVETDDSLHFKSLLSPSISKCREILLEYFRIPPSCSISLSDLHEHFTEMDVKFPKETQGIRVCSQDPFECLLTFLCTSNNNIRRIATMIENFCRCFGSLLGKFDLREVFSDTYAIEDEFDDDKDVFSISLSDTWEAYSFPSIEQITAEKDVLEEKLRKMMFGYRAPFVVGTVEKLENLEYTPEEYFSSLRNESNDDFVLEKLMSFPGVGLKVASCVALYSLGRDAVCPVDTHIWQVHLNKKGEKRRKSSKPSSTEAKDAMKSWKECYGDCSGWAQLIEFANRIFALERETLQSRVAKKRKTMRK